MKNKYAVGDKILIAYTITDIDAPDGNSNNYQLQSEDNIFHTHWVSKDTIDEYDRSSVEAKTKRIEARLNQLDKERAELSKLKEEVLNATNQI